MCAILGITGKNIPERETVIRARDTMVHRGPDDAGFFYAPKEGIALGHRRLSIIDLSPAGRQPFASHDGRFVITYNGEIYNYRELKKELASHYPFKTNTDTEVLLAAYMRWGEKCLQRLNGMFAFAIWDRQKKELFAARDRLGIKPFYYSFRQGSFYFASEIKGILEASAMPRKLNKRGLLDYISYRYPLGENTFFENIQSLSPGHCLIVKDGTLVSRKRYWELPVVPDKKDPGEEEVLKTTEALLKKTVASHMISDVPLGAYLSGGVDSSALVAFMTQLSHKPVKTFSVGFKENGFNEFREARQVAEALGTEHHELLLESKDYLDLLPKVIAYKDAPLHVPNEVPLHALSGELKKHITVVLSGEGADELFGGYGRIFRSGSDFLKMSELDEKRGALSDEEILLKENLVRKYGERFPRTIVEHLLVQYPYTKSENTLSLLDESLHRGDTNTLLNREYFEKEFSGLASLHPPEQLMHFFQRAHLLGILGRLDNAAMGASVEGRVPYIDHQLVEYVSSLPLTYKLRWRSKDAELEAQTKNADQVSDILDVSKFLIRKISEPYLPKDIANRQKVGFPVPLDAWLGSSLKKAAGELLLQPNACSMPLYSKKTIEAWLIGEKAPGAPPTGRDIWTLLNIEVWMREYGVSL